MATDLNRVSLIGRLTRDPELKQTNSGTSYCRFSIANNRNYTSGGERREEVSFINCISWGKQAEIINQYCRKGKQVAIDGRIQQRSWENQEGKKQSAVDVVVEMLQMLGSPGQRSGQPYEASGQNSTGDSSKNTNPTEAAPQSDESAAQFQSEPVIDDDIPF